MKTPIKTSLAAALLCVASTVLGQNITINYQGHVSANGIGFAGSGGFKFALVTSSNNSHAAAASATVTSGFVTSISVTDGGNGYVAPPIVTISGGGGSGATATANISGGTVTSITVNSAGSGYSSTPVVNLTAPPESIVYTTYWSNDGTSTGGSEPSAAVNVNVVNGMFTVWLGDTTLANMMALNATLFTAPNLQLRIWFNDGINGFAVLNPVQNLAFAPYAAFAQSASNLLGRLADAQLDGTYTRRVSFDNRTNSFSGNGAGLTGLNAAQLISGTVPDTRLSANVSLLGQSIQSAEITDGTITAADVNAGSFNTTFWRVDGNAGTTPGTHFVGTTDSQALELKVDNLRALRLEPNPFGAPNLIAGSPHNLVAAGVVGAVIGGGGATNYYLPGAYTNAVHSDFGVVGGGLGNDLGINCYWGTIGGGWGNRMAGDSFAAVIAGGFLNVISNSSYSAIAGGRDNNIGNANQSTIGGGKDNNIWSLSTNAVIAGGYLNDIRTNAPYSAIGGGRDNNIANTSFAATITGGALNNVGTNAQYSAIGGGTYNFIANNAFSATIAGGTNNTISARSGLSAIGGGTDNDIGTNSTSSAIGGGNDNNIGANSSYASIAGGAFNDIGTNSPSSTVGGGRGNDIASDSAYATIGGGIGHDIGTNCLYSTIGGGSGNKIGDNSSVATIAGGIGNEIGTNSSDSVISGGSGNTVLNAQYAIIPGGQGNTATNFAFAAGRNARAYHVGAFVWADAQNNSLFASTADHQVSFRCQGGARFVGSSSGGANQTVSWTPGSASWTFSSDRNLKENFEPVDARSVMEKVCKLPITEWSYKGYAQRHIGPMAQDFQAAFPLNESTTTLNEADLHGVALAAIQGLNKKLEEQLKERDARIGALERTVIELKQLVEQHSLTPKTAER